MALSIEAFSVENLACRRGRKTIFHGLGFKLKRGEALLLQGPNGAGKTTLLRCLAGFLPQVEGIISAVGANGSAIHPAGLPEQMHFIGHAGGIKSRLTLMENVLFWMEYYGGHGQKADETHAEAALAAFGLDHLADIPASHLSAGQGRRLALSRLIAVNRPIWLLDEPLASLDTASASLLLRQAQNHLKAGGLVLLSVHGAADLPGSQTLDFASLPAPETKIASLTGSLAW
jgi:heme exporter protein A